MKRPEDIFILIGCEESQAICLAFRALGFQAFSCDLKGCSGGHPEWHLKMDVKIALTLWFWDGVLLHPECRFMAVSGLFRNLKDPLRALETEAALKFVCSLHNICVDNSIENVTLENPVSCISTRIFQSNGYYFVSPLGKPTKNRATQSIQPYEYGSDASKKNLFVG